MTELQPAMKMTVIVGGDERCSHHPLYQEVLRLLHRENILGATVTKGVMSYGLTRSIHSTLNEIVMDNLPMIIEAIDDRDKIEGVAGTISKMLGDHGLIEMQPIMMAHKAPAEPERSEN